MRRSAARPVIVASMLGLTTILSAVLTAQAILAARDHRATAERVFHDYAALGAEGVAQRLKAALSSRFTSVLLAAAAERGTGPVAVTTLRPTLTGYGRDVLDALGDSGRILRIVPSDSLAPLLRAATAELPDYAYFGMRWIRDARGLGLLVFQPFRGAMVPKTAFTLSDRAASALLAKLVANDPVLPSSITHGATLHEGVGLRVTSAHGDLANRGFDPASPFRVRLALDQPYGDLAVEVSLSEALAPTLIIGGLPRSRVPLLVALLVVTIALTVGAADQLRRELELSRVRDDFVSGVSHELRTPLAQIRMFAETIRLGRVRSPEEGERSLAIVENEARRLEHLVENLLHFTRTQRGTLQIHPEPTNVTSLIQEIVGEFVPLADRGQSRIALALEPDVRADVDPAAIRQIVINLLDNAVKYGRRGQVITVRLSTGTDPRANQGADESCLEVEDEGEGIAAHDRPLIWERFWRAESARRAGIPGTGVGLAIVRDLVRLHGGTVIVERALAHNGATGRGARIVIRLPRASRAARNV